MLVFYIYAYLRTDGSPYYIGKGKGKRAYEKHTVNLPARDKIVFLETHLTEIGAFALERRYILWYGRKDLGTGILRNLTEGGDGTSGRIVTQEQKNKISAALTGKPKSAEHNRNNSLSKKGRPTGRKTMHTGETKKKIKDNHAGMLGRTHTKHTKLKMSLSQKKERTEKQILSGSKSVIINNVNYYRINEALRNIHISKATLLKRLLSDQYPEYKRV